MQVNSIPHNIISRYGSFQRLLQHWVDRFINFISTRQKIDIYIKRHHEENMKSTEQKDLEYEWQIFERKVMVCLNRARLLKGVGGAYTLPFSIYFHILLLNSFGFQNNTSLCQSL